MPTDPCHEFTDVLEQLCGAGVPFVKGQPYPPVVNTGFVSNYATSHSEGTPPQPADAGKIMQGVDIATRAPSLHAFANAFVQTRGMRRCRGRPLNRFFLHGASSAASTIRRPRKKWPDGTRSTAFRIRRVDLRRARR